jgi:hypothetical protein
MNTYIDAVKVSNFIPEFSSDEEVEEFFDSTEFVNWAKSEFGKELPFFIQIKLKGDLHFVTYEPSKQGIPMDWVYFAEFEPITEEAIAAENNIEKRRLLMMEYGINKYLKDVREIQSDAYGTLIDALILDEPQKFVRVRNGTEEPEENKEYLRERGMLTDDGHKIYYIPVPDEIKTAKEGIEWSWDLQKGFLPDKGWDYET